MSPVSSGTYEPSSKLNLKVLQNILKGVYKIQKNEELAREREEEEEQAAQNISNLLADDMELDFDDDDVPVWRSIVNKYREGDQVLQREAVKITHLFKDKKDNEKATEYSKTAPPDNLFLSQCSRSALAWGTWRYPLMVLISTSQSHAQLLWTYTYEVLNPRSRHPEHSPRVGGWEKQH